MDTYEGVGPVELRLRRSVGSFGAVEVTWQALPREADSDDFTPMAGKVTFADGQMEAVIVINVVDDDIPEDLQVSDDRLIALFRDDLVTSLFKDDFIKNTICRLELKVE